MSAMGGGLNRSTQHSIVRWKDGVCSDGSEISLWFHCDREDGVVGSLAERESLKAIGRAFGKPSSSIYYQVAPHGGIRPAPHRRSRLALTLAEREEISRGIAGHQSGRSMARLLGRSPSTVSRELGRNGGYDRYRAALAMRRPSCELVARNGVSWRTVRSYDRPWRGSSDWIGRPSRSPAG